MAVVAKSTCKVAGFRDVIRKGAVYPDDAAVVKARPELFETAEDYATHNRKPSNTAELAGRSMSAPVERATAAPGEKRSTKRPKKADVES